MTKERSTKEIPVLDAPLSEIDLLGIKLQEEISHLEKWMITQQKNNCKSSDAIVNTIQELIQTRKKLLNSLRKEAQTKLTDNHNASQQRVVPEVTP